MSMQMLNEQTFAPATLAKERDRSQAGAMTVVGVGVKTLIFLALSFLFGAIGWHNAREVVGSTSVVWFLVGYIALIALTIMAASNPKLALPAGIVYSILMGLWMGAISRVYETIYDGIVAQAMLASIGAFLGALGLYVTGLVRATKKFTKIVLSAMLGIMLMYLLALILKLFGVDLLMISNPTPLGIILSAGICIVAAANLIIDFGFIDRGVKEGAPPAMEWYCAFGLLSTLVWLYMELLRLIALIRFSNR